MKVLLFVGIIAVSSAICESLECYSCTNCEDPFDEASGYIISCSALPVCVKIVAEFENNRKIVQRSCIESDAPMGLSRDMKSMFPKVTSMYACERDLCNAAPSTVSVSLLLSILTIITMKLIE